MRVRVDGERCIGHGLCEALAEDVFEVGDDGVSRVLVDPVPAGDKAAAADAVRQCPASALLAT